MAIPLLLLNFLFPPPPSLFVTAMSVISFVSTTRAGFNEIKGKHLQYSKFWNVNPSEKKKIQLSGKSGMLLLYSPAFIAGAASFFVFPNESLRTTLLQASLTLHFFKRILEVLFVHKYSGRMILDSVIPICLSYFLFTTTLLYAQQLTLGVPEPPIDLKYLGIALFLIGITGNFYHHYILSKLRENDQKEYKIPKGGLFGLVICPHYLFELIGLYGICLISQTLHAFCFTVGTTFYLIGRSYVTRRWYLSKFEDFPQHVKALIPFVC
ncbi:uncharacterized protein LOC129293800 [Prosopis cineraria]|uniref:uncharacterized protein LOC129293800 n=1 Tax=Prosopis cineraria TaxID=364024 RepID=UPI00240ED14F|nr:uncharacterized protein LOC129293800 [Prosopis cineraria]